MQSDRDKLFDLVTRALDAMIETIELAREVGLYDKQLSRSAFHLVEVGLKLSEQDPARSVEGSLGSGSAEV
jgi:hypothetical protein